MVRVYEHLLLTLQIMKTFAIILAFLMGIVASTETANARTMKDFFISMSEAVMPMLSQNARKDMVDFYESKMKASLPNEWGGSSHLVKLEKDYLVLNENKDGSVVSTMAMMQKGRDTLICVVRTIMMPEPDSEVLFYSTEWNERTDISLPKVFSEEDLGEVVFDHTNITLEQQAGGKLILTYTLDSSDGESKKDNDAPKAMRYQWNGSKFIKI